MKIIDEKPGARYGNWRVTAFDKIDGHGDARWWCRCELCKRIYSVRGFALRNSTTKKCKACAMRRIKHDPV